MPLLLIIAITGSILFQRMSTGKKNTMEEILEPPVEITHKDNEDNEYDENNVVEFEKGYDLPIDNTVKEEAEADCKAAMEQIKEIYVAADKGDASNVVISKETAGEMLVSLQKIGCPVTVDGFYFDMENYEKMEKFLEDSVNGIEGKIVAYVINSSGGIGRMQFSFNGTDMYLLETTAIWNEQNEPIITSTSYSRIKEWKYTEKGWFSFEACVPELPEVSEIINGEVLIRVKPLKKEYRELSERYLIPVGYQGNNLFRSNWDTEHMEEIDYNALF